MTTPIHCALYARVSTTDQTTANQVEDLLRAAALRGWEPVLYEESGSAVKARPVLDRLMDDARAGRIGAVAVWALDRLDRSMPASINRVLELDRLGIPLVSVREPWLDTTGPVRSLLVAIFAWVAEQERNRLIERTRAGMERARSQGVRLGASPLGYRTTRDESGRPSLEPVSDEQATASRMAELRDEGRTYREIAEILAAEGRATKRGGGWQAATVRRVLLRMEESCAA